MQPLSSRPTVLMQTKQADGLGERRRFGERRRLDDQAAQDVSFDGVSRQLSNAYLDARATVFLWL